MYYSIIGTLRRKLYNRSMLLKMRIPVNSTRPKEASGQLVGSCHLLLSFCDVVTWADGLPKCFSWNCRKEHRHTNTLVYSEMQKKNKWKLASNKPNNDMLCR